MPHFIKTFSLFVEKILDFSKSLCYNIIVAWRDGRVGLRRTTGNRVYPNRYQGFESLSLRHAMPPNRVAFFCVAERKRMRALSPKAKGSHLSQSHL